MSSEREEFEAWVKSWPHFDAHKMLTRECTSTDHYMNPAVDGAWLGWKGHVECEGRKHIGWAWKSDGLVSWALGHVKPTAENTHRFYERNFVVCELFGYPKE